MSKRSATTPFPRTIREQIEVFATAILIAVGLRYFLVDAFQIPTPSMQPTLMGSPAMGIRDRILVDKTAYLVAEPQRWQVAVFRYPHNQRQKYIKRVVGLPGETLRIFNGDIYKRGGDPLGETEQASTPVWDAVRKSPTRMQSLWRAIWAQSEVDTPSVARVYDTENAVDGSWTVDRDGALRATASGDRATQTRFYSSKIENRYEHGYPSERAATLGGEARDGEDLIVADLRWSTELEVVAATVAVEMRVFEESESKLRAWSLRLERTKLGRARVGLSYYDDGADLRLGKQPTSMALRDEDFEVGSRLELVLANWDDQCFASVGGAHFGPIPYRAEFDRTVGVVLELVVEGAAVFRNATLARDNCYERALDHHRGFSDELFHVPGGHYWMLGDNQRNSDDGRTWRRMTIWAKDGKLTVPGGGEPIVGSARFEQSMHAGPIGVDANPIVVPVVPSKIVFTDQYGEVHSLEGRAEDLRSSGRGWSREDTEPRVRFVGRRFFVGRAFATIFPFSRIGLIR